MDRMKSFGKIALTAVIFSLASIGCSNSIAVEPDKDSLNQAPSDEETSITTQRGKDDDGGWGESWGMD